MRWRELFALSLWIVALPAPSGAANPRTVFAQHDPEGRLPNTEIKELGTIHVRGATYSIQYLEFSNPVSLHGQERIAIVKNGAQFAGAYECALGTGRDEGKLVVGKDRLTVKSWNDLHHPLRWDGPDPEQVLLR